MSHLPKIIALGVVAAALAWAFVYKYVQEHPRALGAGLKASGDLIVTRELDDRWVISDGEGRSICLDGKVFEVEGNPDEHWLKISEANK